MINFKAYTLKLNDNIPPFLVVASIGEFTFKLNKDLVMIQDWMYK